MVLGNSTFKTGMHTKANIQIISLMVEVKFTYILGTYYWASKATYSGEFKDGKRHGQGIWKSGDHNYDLY